MSFKDKLNRLTGVIANAVEDFKEEFKGEVTDAKGEVKEATNLFKEAFDEIKEDFIDFLGLDDEKDEEE